jgi:hypothetical protein
MPDPVAAQRKPDPAPCRNRPNDPLIRMIPVTGGAGFIGSNFSLGRPAQRGEHDTQGRTAQ